MQATQDEIDILYDIQDIDLEISAKKKEFDALPQRGVIKVAREKRTALQEKLAKIEALGKDAKKRLTRVQDEDSSLEKKEKGVQAAIEAAGNDFRNAETRTKELDGIFRRRGELSEKLTEIKAEIAKIDALNAQVTNALSEIDRIENEATTSFKEEGSSIMNAINDLQKKHDSLITELSVEVGRQYETVSERFDTVSIARLDDNSCSVCRAKIETGHLIDLRNQAPLVMCPSCHRLMIISD